MKRSHPLIALLDDEQQFCKALERLLRTYEFEVVTFTVGEDLLSEGVALQPDCIIMDLHMPGLSGFEVLEQLAAKKIGLPVVVVTGHDQPGNVERVKLLGARDYLLKPLNESELISAIEKNCSLDKDSTTNAGNEPDSV